jgi:predicted lipid-binding transport protein (Tim44 family)
MRQFFSVITALVGLSLIAVDAEAGRLGGGRSIGTQRSITQQQATPKAPAQPQQQQQAAGAPAQQPSGASRWLGPLAGLALGAGLASLFLHNGFAGALAGILMILAIVMVAMYVMRLLRGKTTGGPIQYAGAGAQGGTRPAFTPMFGGGAPGSVAATTSGWPAGFDASEFARHAKLNFVRLQAAHDDKDLAAMRDFMTPGMYKEIEADVRAAGATPQKTDVVTLNAEVLDVATENGIYIVSVRFSGLIREAADQEPQQFTEIWHLEKPVNGSSGWLIAGIQQD